MAQDLRSSRALARAADRQIADLHAAIRCRCCPDGLFTRHLAGAMPPAAAERPYTRADFLGMLDSSDIDPDMDGAA